MQCPQCGQTNLLLIFWDNLDYLCEQVQGQWVYKDPGLKDFFYTQDKRPVAVKCQDCQKESFIKSPDQIFSPPVKHNEITLDLDFTLLFVEDYRFVDNPDIEFSSPEGQKYRGIFRPGLKEFLTFCENRFSKINFYTSAFDWYADTVIKSFKLSPSKIGYIKTRKDTKEERPLSFEWELMKTMSNSLVVEDKPLVIKGKNNRIFKVSSFYGDLKDQELFRLIKELARTEELVFSKPPTVSGEVWLFLRDLNISFKNLPWSKAQEVLSVPVITEIEMNALPKRTKILKNSLLVEKNKTLISLTDLTYANYLVVMAILTGFTDHQTLSELEFNKLIIPDSTFSDF